MTEVNYPSIEEQLRIKGITNSKYPTPKKSVKPSSSYDHWSCRDWFPRADALYFHFEYGRHHYESLIQADFFDYVWHTQREAYVKVDRKTLEMTELTKEEFDITRGSRMTDRGIMEWWKDDHWE